MRFDRTDTDYSAAVHGAEVPGAERFPGRRFYLGSETRGWVRVVAPLPEPQTLVESVDGSGQRRAVSALCLYSAEGLERSVLVLNTGEKLLVRGIFEEDEGFAAFIEGQLPFRDWWRVESVEDADGIAV